MTKDTESKSAILEGMQVNMHFQMTYFAQYAPTMQLIELPDVTVVKSDIADDTFNYVLGAKFSSENVSERVAHTMDIFRESQIPFAWWVSESDTPNSLQAALTQAGLVYKEENIGMYLWLDTFINSPHSRLHFQRVDCVLKLKEFSDIIVAIGGSGEAFQQVYSHIPMDALIGVKDFQMYIGYLEGQPIVSGILVLQGGVAGIYYVATVSKYRQQGFGTAMMRYLLDHAKQSGMSMATLQASREGKSLYEKLGFKVCGIFQEYAG